MNKLKPYPTYKPVAYDYISQLPDSWDIWKISHIFRVIGSGTTPTSGTKEFYENGEIEWVNTGDLNDDYIIESKNKINQIALKTFSTLKKYPANTLLIAMYGATIGKTGIITKESCTNQACCALSNSKNALNRFAQYWFIANRKNIVNLSYGGGQPNISQDVIKKLKIPLPPLTEQNAIVAYLDQKTEQIQTFIAKKQRLIELLEEERKELIDRMINANFKNETKTKPLKYLVKLVSEQTDKKNEDEQYIALENIESWTGKIDLSIGNETFESNVKRFKETDVLFNKLRPYLAKVVVPNFSGVCVSEILVLRPSKDILKEYLFYRLISKRFIDLVDSSTFGSKMPRANWDFIGKINVTYPTCIKEQKEICDKIKEKELYIENLKSKYKTEIEKLKEYQESLITQVVTGQVCVV